MGDDRGGRRRRLGLARDRIGLVRGTRTPPGAEDVVLVALARADTRHEQLPDAGRMADAHGMAARVPGVEIADHRDAARVRRPDGEAHAGNAVDGHRLGAERIGEPEMAAFVEQMQVEVAEQRPERIGILGLLHGLGPGNAQSIRQALADEALEQPLRLRRFEAAEHAAIGAGDHLHLVRARQERADDVSAVVRMRPEHGERVAMRGVRQRIRGGAVEVQRRDIADIVHGAPFFLLRTASASVASPPSGTPIQAGRLAAS